MKTLRYLLIAMVVVLASVPAKAQLKLDDRVEYQFRSTSSQVSGCTTSSLVSSRTTSTLMGNGSISALMSSGSRLPIAARNGVMFAPDEPDEAVLAYIHGHIRRGADPEDTPPDDPEGPLENPIGDGTWPLLLMAMAYCAYVAYRKVRAMRVVRATTSESALEAK